ncbi:SLAP domain-containing protein [Companilactobacillus kimchiensis]|uniref:S-layer protein C-terminal domain-containing protein n=1 Tax=Companilactobacillus kimchiensis TaxID=993692 RepID=A0A0R2L7Q2_9LACO|nr:SLAP domain-containing protein [Companilactobacillus kimchiensis]KRN97747.1 hypothetical protein IV57_GL001589 [Companilactobacillus kimchiensis]
MKKFYGPIVLGIAALTVAAPVVNTTTVLADTDVPTTGTDDGTTEGTPDPKAGNDDKATTGVENGKTDTTSTDKDTLTEQEITEASESYLNKLDDLQAKLTTFNGTTPTLTEIGQYISNQKESINAAKPTTAEDYAELNSDLKAKENDLETKITSNSISSSVVAKDDTDKVTNFRLINIPIEKDPASTITAPKYLTTTGIDTAKDNSDIGLTGKVSLTNGSIVVSPQDDSLKLKDTAVTISTAKDATNVSASMDSIKAAQAKVQNVIYVLSQDTSTNQTALNDMIAHLKSLQGSMFQNKGNGISASGLNDLTKQFNSYVEDNIVPISVSVSGIGTGGFIEPTVPLIKNATVYIPGSTTVTDNYYVAETFDKDGNLISSYLADKNHNVVRTTKVIKSWIGDNSDSSKAITSDNSHPTVINNNSKHHNNNSNHHNSSNNTKTTTKPETKPESTKSISEHQTTLHQTTFYILPNILANLFDENGNVLSERALGGNSAWLSDKLMTLDGVNYLRVSTSEWAKQADGLEVTPLDQSVYTKNDARLYTGNGKLVSDRELASNTAWRTDKSATINGEKMYRVSTNEWVKASDLK